MRICRVAPERGGVAGSFSRVVFAILVSTAIGVADAQSGSSGGVPREAATTGTTGTTSTTVPAAPAASVWKIAVARFATPELQARNAPDFGEIVPRLILERAAWLPDRPVTVPAAASGSGSAAARDRRLFTAGRHLALRLDERESLFLDIGIAADLRASGLRSQDRKIDESRNELRVLATGTRTPAEATGPDHPGTRRSRTAAWWPGRSAGIPLEMRGASAASVAKANDLDALLFGSAGYADGRVFLQLFVYDSETTGIRRLYAGSTPIAALDDCVAAMVGTVEEWIATVPVGRLDIRADPADSTLEVAGMALDTRSRIFFYERAAEVNYRVARPGYHDESGTVVVRPGETVVIRVKPDRKRLPATGSAVPAFDRAAALQEPGRVPGYERMFGNAKDRFYGALGMLVASLPVSILSLGNFTSYREAVSRTDDPGIRRGYTASIALLGAGILTTTTFTILAAIRLAAYIGAAR